MSLLLEIVTPEKQVYSESVTSVVIPTADGEIGVLEGHIPIVSNLLPGELQVEREGKNEYLAVDKGFVQILGDKISVLTDDAIDVAEIDVNAAEKAREAAEQELEAAKGQADFDLVEMELLESRARFALAKELIKKNRI